MYNCSMQPSGFLIMGVSGSGKSTLGKALAKELGWDFFDADDFHLEENISKMAAGVPLTDEDRAPWLRVLKHQLASTLAEDHHPVLACSALKEKYRAHLLDGIKGIAIIYLRGNYQLLWSRLQAREGHYMKENMLRSQIDTLEEPEDAVVLDISLPIDQMLHIILTHYPALERSDQ